LHPAVHRDHHRLFLSLVQSRRDNGKQRTEYLGSLGSISAAEPPGEAERVAFWMQLDARLDAIAARFPVTAEDRAKVRRMVGLRVPPLRTPEERRLLSRAIVQRDALAVLQALGEDAMAEACKRLTELARETRSKAEEEA
jgi:hypothetical protein